MAQQNQLDNLRAAERLIWPPLIASVPSRLQADSASRCVKGPFALPVRRKLLGPFRFPVRMS